MINIDKECPAWIREFVRFLPLKNLIFAYGNILDLISYPIKESREYWVESNLSGFFERYLLELGYDIIGFFDPVEGLSFSDTQMQERFNKTRIEKKPGQIMQSTKSSQPGNESSPAHETQIQKIPYPEQKGTGNHNRIFEDIIKALNNKTFSCVFIFDLASRLATSPVHLLKEEREIFTRILKGSLNATEVTHGDISLNNAIIMVCDKLNDLPSFLYLGNPRARSIHIPKPDALERTRFIQRTYKAFYGVSSSCVQELPPELVSYFVALTEGLTNYEMKSLVRLSKDEKISMRDIKGIKKVCELYKYGIKESEWDKIDSECLRSAEVKIKSRIKGQEAAVFSVLDIIKRAKIGLSAGASGKSNRPRGVLFFAGPTGVGKTELAKALAEILFGNDDRCIRFDMSEYGAEHSDEKLMGAPPGYVGYEEGGQLTNAVKEHPFSILLFDEIEKAHQKIFDKFLQILDDGRLTDGKGETVYFSECIIIFTSNIGTVSTVERQEADTKNKITDKMKYPQIKKTILEEIRKYFNLELSRPEILNRFGDDFVVFDFIRPPVDEEIVDLLLKNLVDSIKEIKKIELSFDHSVRDDLVRLAREKLHHGGRGIRNATNTALVNPLNRALFDRNITEGRINISRLVNHGQNAIPQFDLEIDIQ